MISAGTFVEKMKKKANRRRRFFNGELNHIYQRTISGFNIFYDIEDYIVYFTIFSVLIKCYDITAVGLCLMIDHIHMLLIAGDRKILSKFMDHCTSVFVREYNFNICREGGLFRKRFGSAPKIGLKAIRTAIAYLFNNPVEKQLCKKAEEFRWNFLAYARNAHPFSGQIPYRDMRGALKKAVKEVKYAYEMNNHLKYAQVRRMFSKLNGNEKEILIDFIISTYNPFDYNKLIGWYGSYESMLTAINSNTGSEYEMNEEYNSFPDNEYEKMKSIISGSGINPIRKVTQLSAEHKAQLFKTIKGKTNASTKQISKFLHLPFQQN